MLLLKILFRLISDYITGMISYILLLIGLCYEKRRIYLACLIINFLRFFLAAFDYGMASWLVSKVLGLYILAALYTWILLGM